MSLTADNLLQDALRLPEEERAEIAARLIASLNSETDEDPQVVEQAWAKEIERRCDALDRGTSSTRAWDDLRRDIEVDLHRK